MTLFYQMYRKQLFLSSLIVCLFLWGLFSSLLLLKRDHDVRIIYVSPSGVELVQEGSASLDNIFLKNALMAYVGYCFNYSATSFIPNMRMCGDLMSADLWSQKNDEIGRNFDVIQREQYSIVTSLASEPKLQGDGTIELILKSTKFQKETADTIRVKAIVRLRRIPLSKENTFGFEVVYATETPI